MARKDIFDRIDSKMRNQMASLGTKRDEEKADADYVEKRVSRRVIRRRARKPKQDEVAVEAPAAEIEASAEEAQAVVDDTPASDSPDAHDIEPEGLETLAETPEPEAEAGDEPAAAETVDGPDASEPVADTSEAAPDVVAGDEPSAPEPEAASEVVPEPTAGAELESAPAPEPELAPEPETASEVVPEAAADADLESAPATEPEPAPDSEPDVAAEAADAGEQDPAAEPEVAEAPSVEASAEPLAEVPVAEPEVPLDAAAAAKAAAEKSLEDLLREQGIVQHKPRKGRRIVDQTSTSERRPIPKPVIRHDIRAQQMLKQARQAGMGAGTADAPTPAGQPRDGARRRSVTDQRIERDLRAERERERKLQQQNQRRKKGRRKSIVQRPDMMYYPDRRSTRKKGPPRGSIGLKTVSTIPKEAKRVIRIEDEISVGELAKALGIKSALLIRKFIEMGQMVTVNQFVDQETATLVAAEFDYRVENVAFKEEEFLAQDADAPEDLVERPPVITIMGHVDHGKTSILDTIRSTKVAEREAGGITQHIGAYQVEQSGQLLTFLDTPGHEAFTAMRARGAQVTDLAVLVVAANDGVMPQTIESINHARAAEVPLLVAINKIDLAKTNIDRVKQELSEQGLQPEDWGGDTVMVPVSATKNIGIDDLLEMIALQAEMLEIKANPTRIARGVVVEAKLSKGVGPVATVLVQHGTLKAGDYVVAGTAYGRIRAMMDYSGNRIKEATPATPAEIHGLSSVPDAGDEVAVVDDERAAKAIIEHRQEEERAKSMAKTARVTMDNLADILAARSLKDLKLVLKTDVHGSQEALREAIMQIEVPDTTINILHAAVGGITESDVTLAAASDGMVIGFHVRPDTKAAALAERQGVDIRTYRVIYEALEDIRGLLTGLLDPEFEEKVQGSIEVRDTFKIPKVGVIAGCFVTDGKAGRNHKARLLRSGVVVWEGKLSSLKRFKEDVKEVAKGFECGLGLQDYHDIKKGDVIETYTVVEVARKL